MPLSNRLSRLLTVDVDSSHSNYNESLQDLNYTYDAVGNITYITDSAQQAVFYSNSYVPPDQDYTYDSLYRLVMAGGRELKGLASVTSFGSRDNTDDRYWMNSPQPGDGTAMQNYLQKYEYDKAGNMRTLKHIANTGSYTRSFGVAHTNNRLTGSNAGIGANPATAYSYNYDARGNMTSMPHLGMMSYDALNQMVYCESGVQKANYQYSGGQRVRKLVSGSVAEERIYLGSYEVYRKYDNMGAVSLERTTVHVGDDSGRIAMIEARTHGSDGSPALLKRFIYSNHLQSAALEVDENGSIISYEEYHPYGTTSYQAMDSTINATAKRYRYTGKERDEESGLNYHGARYYAPWLCRWCAVDPLESKYTPWSPYAYVHDNPVNDTDSTGLGDDGKDDKGVIEQHTVQNRYEPGTTPNDLGLEIPKGYQVMRWSENKDSMPYVISMKAPDGTVYNWNDKSQWYTSKDGKDFSNPLFEDIYNWAQTTTRHGIGQFAQDAISSGDPFLSIKQSYSDYKKDGGTWGPLGFVGNGLKESISKTVSDVQAGGQRRTQAMIGIWQFGYNLGKPVVPIKGLGIKYLFRGTTEGFEGSTGLLSLHITPTTPNPAKATVFAIASKKHGNGVLHIASRENLKHVTSTVGNVLAHAEEEVPLNILPKQFAAKAGLTITAQQAQTVLKNMGINIPLYISNSEISRIIESLPVMTQRQISTFVKHALKIQ